MTTMELEIKDLLQLGFNKNEAIVYLSLIKFNVADARRIIQDTKFHKAIVYDNLDKLLDKGLVCVYTENRKKIFKISNPNSLVEFFNEKEKQVINQKQIAKKIAKQIVQVKTPELEDQVAEVHRGIKAIRNFYYKSLESKKDYVVLGAPKESVEIMGQIFWKNYHLKRIRKKISINMIFNSSLKKFGESLKNKYTKIKYFEQEFEPLTETHIQEDFVAIIVWTKDPILFLIKNDSVSKSYLKFFEKLWKQAK